MSYEKWSRFFQKIRIQRNIQNSIDYYYDILQKCSKHAEILYDNRIIKRYNYNDTIKLIKTAHFELDRLNTTNINDLMKRPLKGLLRPLVRLVERAVFSVGVSNVIELLEYLGCYTDLKEHYEWLKYCSTPCVVSRELGKCSNIFFRNVTLTNINSYVDNQSIWLSIPYSNKIHIAIKLVIGRDPNGLIKRAFHSKIRRLNSDHRSLLWAIHPKQFIASSLSEIRSSVQKLIKMRERISKTPIGKLIQEFISADTTKRVSLFCSMCIPLTLNIDSSKSPVTKDKSPIHQRIFTDEEIDNPFKTRNKIPRTPTLMENKRTYIKDNDVKDIENDEDEDEQDSYSISSDSSRSVDSPVEPDKEMDPLLSTMYDLVANHSFVNRRDIIDSIDLLPWEVQRKIRNIRDYVVSHPPIEEDEIPNETRIQLLPIDESTKRTVYSRIKEAKNRGGDSSTKAASWVNGFFRIPFGIFRKEPILQRRAKTLHAINETLHEENITGFHDIVNSLLRKYPKLIISKEDYRGIFWSDYVILESLKSINDSKTFKEIMSDMGGIEINIIDKQITYKLIETENPPDAAEYYAHITSRGGIFPNESSCKKIGEILNRWYSHRTKLAESLKDTRNLLNKCVRFQENAKDHVMRVIGQWMVGKDNGYCLGFEGPPGVGKTTLAREGLAKILRDESGKPRPFRMIALGTLVGHNYTYQSSQWGDIVRILMEAECMNPIIYVDELDKVSQTENGKEIISILTHLTDPAQNEEFQDRYFSGVRLNMSKVLFVFSYNDPSKIDPILLDRIHRIHFDPMTTHEKLKVINSHTLPEISKDLCMSTDSDAFKIGDFVLRELIHRYTNEAGLRKIKEILYISRNKSTKYLYGKPTA
jgi:hypothetical protein